MQESQATGEAISTRDLWTDEAQPRRLTPICKIIKRCMSSDEALPWRLAVEQVLKQLQSSSYKGYRLVRPGLRAEAVTDKTEFCLEVDGEFYTHNLTYTRSFWEGEQDRSEAQKYIRRGCAGVVEWLRAHWLNGDATEESLGAGERGRLCMLLVDAESMFGYREAAASNKVVPSEPAGHQSVGAVPEVVDAAALPAQQRAQSSADAADLEPKVTPHVKGAEWTDAERQTMCDLRKAGVTDVEIARKFGCERATIHQQIGARKKRAGTDSGSAWVFSGLSAVK